MRNGAAASAEALFRVQLPDAAYISAFSVTIGNQTFYGTVKERAVAEREYEKQRAANKSTALISARDMQEFGIVVTLAAGQRAVFVLTYEQLLQRRLGRYDLVLNVNPGQIVQGGISIRAEITEPAGIAAVTTPALAGTVSVPASTYAVVTRELGPGDQGTDPNGLAVDFVVRYTPANGPASSILVNGMHFAHFFAPTGLVPLGEDIVWVFDRSGSMSGYKMVQAQQALTSMLDKLTEAYRFNIITFDDVIISWKIGVVPATKTNVDAAKAYVNKISPGSSTNINDALLTGIDSFTQTTDNLPVMVLLTDGQPTTGECVPAKIRANVRQANAKGISIFTLGFGFDLDYELLRMLALENNGFDRRIYEDSDAVEQLTGFFDEIVSPSLRSVSFSYLPSGAVVDQTRLTYPFMFAGSELVVAGRFPPSMAPGRSVVASNDLLTCKVTGTAGDGMKEFVSVLNTSAPDPTIPTERMWATLMIQRLLDEMDAATNNITKAAVREKALSLALQYQLVTPLSSMIIVLPDENTSNSTLKGTNNDENADTAGSSSTLPTAAATVMAILFAIFSVRA
jgi:uncharacterized protein YegL